MPPGQAAKSKNPKTQPRDRRSRSRNTTPVSAVTEASSVLSALSAPSVHSVPSGESAYLRTPLSSLLVPTNSSIESLIEKAASNPATPPSASSLGSLHDDIVSQVLGHVSARGAACDRSMRELARKRKERVDAEREREERESVEEERRKREVKKAAAHANGSGKKRDRAEMESDKDSRPPAVGAHGLARQDGVDVHQDVPPPSSPMPMDLDMDMSEVPATAIADDTVSSPSNSETSHQPPPARTVANYQSFGDDPTKYNDPTIYDIRELTPDMTDDEKKAILCVEDFPHDDLHDLTPGTPPDMDYSSGKAANQVAFTTFQAYVEPYVRPLTEEDVAFLKERGERVEPFIMPARGPLPYREVWSREDGHNPRELHDSKLPPNEARGSIEDMNEDAAQTDEISTGPLLTRLLQTFRHEPNAANPDINDTHVNGDTIMTNGETTGGDQDLDATTHMDDASSFKPATFFPDSTGFKPPGTTSRSFASMDQRLLAELRYLGLITPDATPDYDGHYDDDISARLRQLQTELRSVATRNAARKARVLELTEERMAMQEYATIADDLDTQINTAYLKRNRTMSKPKKGGVGKPRPGQAVAVSRNVVSEGTRMLMERRAQWKDLIGPVVEFGQKGIPPDTVFDEGSMERLLKAEAEVGDPDGE